MSTNQLEFWQAATPVAQALRLGVVASQAWEGTGGGPFLPAMQASPLPQLTHALLLLLARTRSAARQSLRAGLRARALPGCRCAPRWSGGAPPVMVHAALHAMLHLFTVLDNTRAIKESLA